MIFKDFPSNISISFAFCIYIFGNVENCEKRPSGIKPKSIIVSNPNSFSLHKLACWNNLKQQYFCFNARRTSS